MNMFIYYRYALIVAFVCAGLVGCGDSSPIVKGRVYVITKGQEVVNMPNVEVMALNESALTLAMKECTAQLANEFPTYQKRFAEASAHAAARSSNVKQSDKQWAESNSKILQINLDIKRRFGTLFTAMRKPLREAAPFRYGVSSTDDDMQYVDNSKAMLKDYLLWASGKLNGAPVAPTFGEDAEQQRQAQAKYQQCYAYYQSAMPAVEAAEQQIAALEATKDNASQQRASIVKEGDGSAFDKETLAVETEWSERQAKVVNAKLLTAQALDNTKTFYGKKAKTDFQTTQTDTDGRYTFRLPTAGDYIFIGCGERQVFDKTEKYLWTRRATLRGGSTYTMDLNNDNELSSKETAKLEGIEIATDTLFLSVVKQFGLQINELQ
jgi:hypothetical protein